MIPCGRILGRDVEAHTPLPCPWCGHPLGHIVRTATDTSSQFSVCVYCEHPIRYVLGENRIERVELVDLPPEVRAEFEEFIAVLHEAKAKVRSGAYP